MIVFACIAPHGDMDLDPALRAAMEELGRRFDDADVETAIVVTPHNVHVQAHFAVVTAARIGDWECDRDTAAALLASDLPILGVSFGGNDPATATAPLDWGALIPLWVMGGRSDPPVSAGRMSILRCNKMSPVSRPSSMCMTVTPVSRSPAAIAA